MISDKDIANLLSLWRGRLGNTKERDVYDTLNDCIYELSQLYMYSIPPEYLEGIPQNILSDETQDYLDNIEADDYLSTIEAHEIAV